jgi:hypothetical protein
MLAHCIFFTLNQDCEVLKGHGNVKNTNEKLFSPSIILMNNLDHSLVHVLYKQEKISNIV